MKKGLYLTLVCFMCMVAGCQQGKKTETVEPAGEGVKVVVSMTIKEEYEDVFLDAFRKMADETRKEKGCIYYDLHQDLRNPLKYVLLEYWATQEDLDAHGQTEHMKVYREASAETRESSSASFVKQVY